MHTDKLYTNCFFIAIDLDWLEHPKSVEFLVFNVIFLCQKSAQFGFQFRYCTFGRTLLKASSGITGSSWITGSSITGSSCPAGSFCLTGSFCITISFWSPDSSYLTSSSCFWVSSLPTLPMLSTFSLIIILYCTLIPWPVKFLYTSLYTWSDLVICFDSELFPQNFVWQLNNDRKSLDLYYECLK